MSNSLTTIPIEVLFSLMGGLMIIIGSLLGFIGNGILKEIRALRGESTRRGNQIAAVHTILGVICGKLGIDYNPPDP